MAPSDKNKLSGNSSSGKSSSDVCSQTCSMEFQSEHSSCTTFISTSSSNVTLSGQGASISIPWVTADQSTTKCSVNDQIKTFDPGEDGGVVRLSNSNNGNSVFLTRNSSVTKNSNKNYKAGSKINKLADMLAKRSQSMVEVKENNLPDAGKGSLDPVPTQEKLQSENSVSEIIECVNGSLIGSDVDHEEESCVRKSRRKSVPNPSCSQQHWENQSTSKSCSDLSRLIPLEEKTNKELNALEKSVVKLETEESTKKKVVRKKLTNVKLPLILPEKKKLKNNSSQIVKNGEKSQEKDYVCQKNKNKDKGHGYKPCAIEQKSREPVPSKKLKKETKTRLRKSKRLVENSIQTGMSPIMKEIQSNEHIPKKGPILNYECLYCSKIFSESSLCKSHEKSHSLKSSKQFKCQFCSKKLNSLHEIKTHCIHKHPHKYSYCLKCDERFPTEDQLFTHNMETHLSESEPSGMSFPQEYLIQENQPEGRENEEKIEKKMSKNAAKSDLKIDVSYDSSKKCCMSPRNIQRSSPKESKSEEQLLEMEMLFYSHLSGNIQENLANHLDGKLDKSGNPVHVDLIPEAADNCRATSLLSVAPPAVGTPDAQFSRAPSPYQTRSKTPNPLPPTAKKFKKLPNWQQKFWEKYNFPTNYRYEHRFWDKNYFNTEKSAFYLKDLSCLDIKTQLTMRENIKKLDEVKKAEENLKTKEDTVLRFPDYLSLVPKLNKLSHFDLKMELKKTSLESSKTKKQETKEEMKNWFKSPGATESSNLKTHCKTNSGIDSPALDKGHSGKESIKMKTRRQTSLESVRNGREGGGALKKRKSSLDLSLNQKMSLRRQTSLENLSSATKHTATVELEPYNLAMSPLGCGEISGEWVRPRSYLCGTCCAKFTNLWELEDHKWVSHPNVWCTHYEFEDDKIDKLFQKNETSVTEANDGESTEACKSKLTDLYRRYLLPHGSLKTAKLVPKSNYPEQCTKCKKNCMNSSEMHKHMLDCGGDTNWFLTMHSSPMTIKRKWRPFGSRRKKQIGRRDVKRNIPATPTIRSYHYQHRIRTKPGDVETIQKMLANLPEKRARRAINFEDIKTRSQTTIHSNRLLRKRFNSSFTSNFLKFKSLKQKKHLGTLKKEDTSKSPTESSSDSTPVGTPKRKMKLKESLHLLKEDNSRDGSRETSSVAPVKIPHKKHPSCKKESTISSFKFELNSFAKKSLPSSVSEKPLTRSNSIATLPKESKTRTKLFMRPRLSSSVTNERKTSAMCPPAKNEVPSSKAKKRGPARTKKSLDSQQMLDCQSSSLGSDMGSSKVMRAVVKVTQPTKLETGPEKKIKISRTKNCQSLKSRDGPSLRFSQANTAKTQLLKTMRKKVNNSRKLLEKKEMKKVKATGKRRSSRLKSLLTSNKLDSTVEGFASSLKKDSDSKMELLQVSNSVFIESEPVQNAELPSEIVPEQPKSSPGSPAIRRSSRKSTSAPETPPNSSLRLSPRKNTKPNLAKNVLSKSPDETTPLSPKKSTPSVFEDTPKTEIKSTGAISLEASPIKEHGVTLDSALSRELEEMPVLAKVEPVRGGKTAKEIPILSPVGKESGKLSLKNDDFDCIESIKFQVAKKKKKNWKQVTPLKIIKKIENKPTSKTVKQSEEKIRNNFTEGNAKLDSPQKNSCARPRATSVKKIKTKLEKYFLEIDPTEIDKGRSAGLEESGSDNEPLISFIESQNEKRPSHDLDLNLNAPFSTSPRFLTVKKSSQDKELSPLFNATSSAQTAARHFSSKCLSNTRLFENKSPVKKKTFKPSKIKSGRGFLVKTSKGKRPKNIDSKGKNKNKNKNKEDSSEKLILSVSEESLPPSFSEAAMEDISEVTTVATIAENCSDALRRSFRKSGVTLTKCNRTNDKEVKIIEGDSMDRPNRPLKTELDAKQKVSARKSKKGTNEGRFAEEKPEQLDDEIEVGKVGEPKLREKLKATRSRAAIVNKLREARRAAEIARVKVSSKRLSLKLFQFNKRKGNFGKKGLRLAEAKRNAERELMREKLESLPCLPFLAAEIKENPVQVIRCGVHKAKICKKASKKHEIKNQRSQIHMKISLPLDILGGVAAFNNNHLTELVPEKVITQMELDPVDKTSDSISVETETEKPSQVLKDKKRPSESFAAADDSDTPGSGPSANEAKTKNKRSEVIDKIFYCEICKTYYYSCSQLKTHKLSNRHKLKESQLEKVKEGERKEELGPDVGGSYCEKPGDDSSEMPTLEGPFIENPTIRMTGADSAPAPALPPPASQHLASISSLALARTNLKDIQTAIGCTNEEMLILSLLGDNAGETNKEILNLDTWKASEHPSDSFEDKAPEENSGPETRDKTNGVFPADLKQRMTSALACLVNKAVLNLLQKYETAARSAVDPEALSLLGKLSNLGRRKDILQLDDLLKKRTEVESGGSNSSEDKDWKENPASYKYQCTICGSRFEKASTRECHISRSHRAKPKKTEEAATPRPCPALEPEWLDSWSCDTALDHFPGPEPDPELGPNPQFWCSDCGINFVSPQQVLDHQKVEHQPSSKESENSGNSGPLQSSTIGSSDEILEGKKQRRRPKILSSQELDQQRIIANNELRKLDRKFSNKAKSSKIKWGMDALKFTVEKEDAAGGSGRGDVVYGDASKTSHDAVKNIDLVPKLNLSRVSNIPEFKVIQKNSLRSRFQKIIDNKLKRKSAFPSREEVVLDETEEELLLLPVVVKKKHKKPKSGNRGCVSRKQAPGQPVDVYDFNESESDAELAVYSHVKKPISLPASSLNKSKSSKAKEAPSKNKADSTTKDLTTDDYDSEDSLPLAVVKKSRPGDEDEERGEKHSEEEDKAEGILEQVEYLIEQLEHETAPPEKGGKPRENLSFEPDFQDCADKKSESSGEPVLLKAPFTTGQSIPINVAFESFEARESTPKSPSKVEFRHENVNVEEDGVVEPEKRNEAQETSPSSSEEDATTPILEYGKTNELLSIVKEADDEVNVECKKADWIDSKDEFASRERFLNNLTRSHSEEPVLVQKSSISFQALNGNVIYKTNDSETDFDSESNDALISSPNLNENSLGELDGELSKLPNNSLIEKEKSDEKDSEETSDSEQSRTRLRKKRVPSLVATVEEKRLSKNEQSPESKKEVIVRRIWSRKKEEENCNEMKRGTGVPELIGEETREKNSKMERGREKEIIVRKIWSRKKQEDDGKRGIEESKRWETEVSDEVVIKCGPKAKSPRRRKSANSGSETSKESIVRRIWSGKCGFQTKAALKTYDSDSRIESKNEKNADTKAEAKKRGRAAACGSSKRIKVESEQETEYEDDDLDSLLEEIEREQLEQAMRCEFLQMRRSERGNQEGKDAGTPGAGLFAESVTESGKRVGEKRKRKVKRKGVRGTKQSGETARDQSAGKKSACFAVVAEEEKNREDLSDGGRCGKRDSEQSEGSFVEESKPDAEGEAEKPEKKHKSKWRKHRRHKHHHHHHRHKHKKSRRRKSPFLHLASPLLRPSTMAPIDDTPSPSPPSLFPSPRLD